MKTKDIIDNVASSTGKTKAEVKEVFDAIVEEVLANVKRKDETELGKLGKIKIAHRAAGKARNLATGAEIDVPAKDVPRFTFGKAVKDAANS